ncbi:RTA1 like protein-domain-containing protein [Podospora appendiculata]|uniref:RTA1 like protein-domain-containing protein n=1 Tax=Podospora appendiculata TaxID=314037 RepID=A0AAE1CGY0_9PEZI|nr:RTA1 like protein-domain-containing protein [Podospora appendiculata]
MSNSTANIPPPPPGYRGWFLYCRDNPTDPFCIDNVRSYYLYRICLAANAILMALFGLSLVGFVTTYALTRRGLGFTVAFVLGIICEILGYAGRIMSWKNQWADTGFLIQITCLTIGPAFMAAGIYLCLRRIVYTFGPENSRIAPEMYTRFFIPCDVISLVLQAVGGAMASIASQNNKSVDLGDNIMIAGLSFQVATLLVFMVCAADFGFNVRRRIRKYGADGALDQHEAVRRVRNSWRFKGLLVAMAVSTICIFWRSVYRVAELSRGWEGPLMRRQDLFVGFEGVMIIIACLVLNAFHPSVCFREIMEGAGGIGSKRKAAGGSECVSRESNTGPIDGNDGFYH